MSTSFSKSRRLPRKDHKGKQFEKVFRGYTLAEGGLGKLSHGHYSLRPPKDVADVSFLQVIVVDIAPKRLDLFVLRCCETNFSCSGRGKRMELGDCTRFPSNPSTRFWD